MKLDIKQGFELYRHLGRIEGAASAENEETRRIVKASAALIREQLEAAELVEFFEQELIKSRLHSFSKVDRQPHICICNKCKKLMSWEDCYSHKCKEELT